MENKIVALIPARSGSKRLPNKNLRRLAGHPLLAYSVAAARESGIFAAIICATDSEEYADAAKYYGAEVPCLRPQKISADNSPDIEWVEWILTSLREAGREFAAFSILRPTSPFRKAETIRRAWNEFSTTKGIDSIRAVEKCRQHPGKMWVVRGGRMTPLLPLTPEDSPWHSNQYAALPEVYVQNASLEMAWTRVVFEGRTIAGQVVAPFYSQGDEGLDVNDVFDWWKAEHMLTLGEAALPRISQQPWQEN